MTCNHCSNVSTEAAKAVGAPEVEATWAENRDHPRFCPTCHGFLRGDGGCTKCEGVTVTSDGKNSDVPADPETMAMARPSQASVSGVVSFTDALTAINHRCASANLGTLGTDERDWLRQRTENLTSLGRSEVDRILSELVDRRVQQRQGRQQSAFVETTAEAVALFYPSEVDIWAASQLLGGKRFRLTFSEGVEFPVKPGEKTPPAEAMVVDIGDSNKGVHFTANVNNAMPFRIEALPTGKIIKLERVDVVHVLPPLRQALTCGHVLRTRGREGEETWCRHCDDWATIGMPDCDLPLDFGKHRGLMMSEVLETDPDYIEWVAGNARSSEYRLAAETMIVATMTEPENFILGFGKYGGKTMGEVAEISPDYLRWLAGSTNCRVRTAATMLLQGD